MISRRIDQEPLKYIEVGEKYAMKECGEFLIGNLKNLHENKILSNQLKKSKIVAGQTFQIEAILQTDIKDALAYKTNIKALEYIIAKPEELEKLLVIDERTELMPINLDQGRIDGETIFRNDDLFYEKLSIVLNSDSVDRSTVTRANKMMREIDIPQKTEFKIEDLKVGMSMFHRGRCDDINLPRDTEFKVVRAREVRELSENGILSTVFNVTLKSIIDSTESGKNINDVEITVPIDDLIKYFSPETRMVDSTFESMSERSAAGIISNSRGRDTMRNTDEPQDIVEGIRAAVKIVNESKFDNL